MPAPDEILTNEQIEEIEARANAASEGPWRWRRDYEMPDGSKHWELSNPEGDRQRKTIDASLVLLLDRDVNAAMNTLIAGAGLAHERLARVA